MRARSLPFIPLEEGHHVSGQTGPKISPRPVRPASEYDPRPVQGILSSPQAAQVIQELSYTRWTGRPGYSFCALVGAWVVKRVYGLPSWTRTAQLIRDHEELRSMLGASPSPDACYRFTAKSHPQFLRLEEIVDSYLRGPGRYYKGRSYGQ
jgi:hypothetical protein